MRTFTRGRSGGKKGALRIKVTYENARKKTNSTKKSIKNKNGIKKGK